MSLPKTPSDLRGLRFLNVSRIPPASRSWLEPRLQQPQLPQDGPYSEPHLEGIDAEKSTGGASDRSSQMRPFSYWDTGSRLGSRAENAQSTNCLSGRRSTPPSPIFSTVVRRADQGPISRISARSPMWPLYSGEVVGEGKDQGIAPDGE